VDGVSDFLTAAHLILGAPFVGGLAFLITCAVVWVGRIERLRELDSEEN
jgi:hypothetical protein